MAAPGPHKILRASFGNPLASNWLLMNTIWPASGFPWAHCGLLGFSDCPRAPFFDALSDLFLVMCFDIFWMLFWFHFGLILGTISCSFLDFVSGSMIRSRTVSVKTSNPSRFSENFNPRTVSVKTPTPYRVNENFNPVPFQRKV